MPKKIAIIGAGVIGLSTAVCIQETLKDVEVTIYAEFFTKDTTSEIAAGVFRVETTAFPNNPPELLKQLSRDSFERMWGLALSAEGPLAGVTLMPLYQLEKHKNPKIPAYSSLAAGFRSIEERELKALNLPDDTKSAFFSMTTITECCYYLPYLTKRFLKAGGRQQYHKFTDLTDVQSVSLTHDLIVNCSGLGSLKLFNDQKMFPIRGQVLRVKAPWQKFSFHEPTLNTYVYTARDNVVVGGTKQKGDWDTSVRREDTEDILARVSAIIPSVKHAEVIKEIVGLRPGRHALRIELDQLITSEGTRPLVHNYGHGSHGVALSWGSAVEATRLVQKAFDVRETPKSRL